MSASTISFIDVLIALNTGAVIVLSLYALHQGVLLLLYVSYHVRAHLAPREGGRFTRDAVAGARLDATAAGAGRGRPGLGAQVDPCPTLPVVTVQLPLYNERYVVERVIAAACALDYPRELLQVQVLDDSTDDTIRIAEQAVCDAREQGIDIELIHRENRAGYKAGALQNGLATARGELVAIFDADFIPPRNFLRRVICEHRAFDNPSIGFAQTRWGYLNRKTNPWTRAQVVLLDMHFVIDQYVRSHAGLRMNFNGSGGIWRRACLETAGGWQSDTLTEDLDLSYRAQLHGWRGLYLEGEVCPGELPQSVLSFKRQQARWARGTAQCVRKLLPRIVRSNMSALHKVAAFMHLSGYFANIFVLLLALITPLLMIDSSGLRMLPQWLSAISVVGLSPLMAMFVAQLAQGRTADLVHDLPVAIMLGIGVSLANSVGVLVGLFGKSSGEWMVTPKSAAQSLSPLQTAKSMLRDRRASNQLLYALRNDWTVRVELLLGLYALGTCVVLALRGAWLSLLPVLLYAGGFLMVVWGQLSPSMWLQLRARARTRQRKVEYRSDSRSL
jgi:cellulose synthase/poly-beta-1,6-N-acetylglucosamine synthase-like glycosyltransferase